MDVNELVINLLLMKNVRSVKLLQYQSQQIITDGCGIINAAVSSREGAVMDISDLGLRFSMLHDKCVPNLTSSKGSSGL